VQLVGPSTDRRVFGGSYTDFYAPAGSDCTVSVDGTPGLTALLAKFTVHTFGVHWRIRSSFTSKVMRQVPECACEYAMHMELPWIEGPRAPRQPAPRVWAPRLGHPVEAVITGPIRRLAVHWIDGRHWLHYPSPCPACDQSSRWVEHGYCAALCRCTSGQSGRPYTWTAGVLQLSEGPLDRCHYRATDVLVYSLRRTQRANGLVEVTSSPCPPTVWAGRRPVDVCEVLTRLYGAAWRHSGTPGAKP
jgi:hypothetical protein